MTDPAAFPSAQQFSGFRFADPAIVQQAVDGNFAPVMQEKPTKLTNADMTCHVWGMGIVA